MNLLASDLSPTDVIRPGAARDCPAVLRLLERARRVYVSDEHPQFADWVENAPSALWQRGQTLLGAVIFDVSPPAAAWLRMLAIRYGADQATFFERVWPCAEELVARSQTTWRRVAAPDDWLIGPLAAAGYAPWDRIVTYHRPSPAVAEPLAIADNQRLAIGPATVADLPAILSLDARAFQPRWWASQESLRQGLRCDALLLAATQDEHIIGYAMVSQQGAAAQIVRLAVDPCAQRRGVGARLMQHVMRMLAERGAQSLTLNTQEANLPSRRLYEKLGFVTTGLGHECWAKQLNPLPSAGTLGAIASKSGKK